MDPSRTTRYSIDFCLKLTSFTILEENISISDDHSLVLACTWINLKASALLAAALVVNFGHQMSPLEIEASGEQRAELGHPITSFCLSPSCFSPIPYSYSTRTKMAWLEHMIIFLQLGIASSHKFYCVLLYSTNLQQN